jgi:adenosyl cobinamide kinase/adenosyl cobinamide phosphate guanylyltransferase
VITLVLGGTRSGKSDVAERLASQSGPEVTYVATATVDPADADFVARVRTHQDRRPATWNTNEAPTDLASTLMRVEGTVLVDSLGTWLAAAPAFAADVEGLVRALTLRPGSTVVVSEEVGLGVHAPTEVGVQFADALGAANRRLADAADRVLLVVAGRTLDLGRDA